jgi:hypothetical protein
MFTSILTWSKHKIDIYRRPDGSLGHRVYRKSTHTNLYLNAASHHYPSNKQAALSTLVHRARALCDQDSLLAELRLLGDVFRKNGYNNRQSHRVLNRRPNISRPEDKPDSVAFLPYVGAVFKPYQQSVIPAQYQLSRSAS